MAKRKVLKKFINSYMESSIVLSKIIAILADGENKEKAQRVAKDVDDMRKDLISRVSHAEQGDARAYFRALIGDMDAAVKRFMGELQTLLPAELP